MRRKGEKKSTSAMLSVNIPSTLKTWVEETAKRHGVSNDRVVEGALKEFSADRTIEDTLIELKKQLARIEHGCRRVMVSLGQKGST